MTTCCDDADMRLMTCSTPRLSQFNLTFKFLNDSPHISIAIDRDLSRQEPWCKAQGEAPGEKKTPEAEISEHVGAPASPLPPSRMPDPAAVRPPGCTATRETPGSGGRPELGQKLIHVGHGRRTTGDTETSPVHSLPCNAAQGTTHPIKPNPSSCSFSSNHTTPPTYTLFSLTPCLPYHSCNAGPLLAPILSGPRFWVILIPPDWPRGMWYWNLIRLLEDSQWAFPDPLSQGLIYHPVSRCWLRLFGQWPGC